MAKNYGRKSGIATRNVLTPANVQAHKDEVLNDAGGYVFKVDPLERLKRFVILGSTGGTYYVSEKKLTADNAKNIQDLFKDTKTGIKAIDLICELNSSGRVPKVDPSLFALAVGASCDNDEVRKYALSKVPVICRISTHLFTFISFCDGLRGWGKGLRNAISNWYTNMPISKLAYQACKYPQRRVENELPWSHRDLLRKIHLTPTSTKMNKLFKYIVEGKDLQTKEWVDKKSNKKMHKQIGFNPKEFASFEKDKDLQYVWAHEEAKKATTSKEIVKLIDEFGISRESIPNNLFSNDVWFALLSNDMPLTAMIRNIRNMTKSGVLAPLSNGTKIVVNMLNDEENLHKSRIHPISVLAALNAYAPNYFGGYYSYSNVEYKPVPQIVDALENAFYKSFSYVNPTNKNILIAVDVSGSMTSPMQVGIPGMTSCMFAAAMAMVIARTEKNYHIMGFAHQFKDLGITAKDSIQDAMRKAVMNNFGGTDCAVPFKWALDNKISMDCCCIISDMQTWYSNEGSGHPYQMLKKYRSQMNRPGTKVVAVCTTSQDYSIVNPNEDSGVMNTSGADASLPQIISDFIRGDI